MRFAEYAKAYVALVALVAAALTDLVPGATAQLVVRIVLAVAGAFAVWKVPNA